MFVEKGYQTIQSYDCFSTCVMNYINYYQIPMQCHDIFLLGTEFDMEYSHMLENDFDLGIPLRRISLEALKRMNIESSEMRFSTREEAFAYIEQMTIEENPIIIGVETKHLTYHPIFQEHDSTRHWVNIIGINKETKEVCISDGYIPDYEIVSVQQWISYETLYKAWSETEYYTILLSIDEETVSEICKLTDQLKKENKISLVNGLKQYLEGTVEKDNVYKGKLAIIQLEKEIESMIMQHQTDILKFVHSFNYKLKVNGFYAMKQYLLSYLEELGGYEELARRLNESIQKWDVIGAAMFKIGYKMRLNDIARIETKIHELNELDEKIYSDLIECMCES